MQWDNFFTINDITLRLIFFLGLFFIFSVLEVFIPRRSIRMKRIKRWPVNIAITVINSVILRFAFVVYPSTVAVFAAKQGWGLLNLVSLPEGAEILIAVVLFDFAVYMQHVLFHTIPVLWKLHMMHHADLDLDVTTGNRFHPIEMIISMIIKISVVALIGPPVAAVLIFEILLNGTSMFNHSNLRLPLLADKLLRLFIVTPDMHRVHHSVAIRETNSNFGFNLSWWDRLLGTYRDQPARGHVDMKIGLAQHQEPGKLTLWRMVLFPFVGDSGRYAINARGGDPQKNVK